MKWSARLGACAAGLGALLGCFLALRKSSHTKRRKVYVPTPLERFLGWFAVFAILEGCLRFFMTIYWAWVDYQNGRMGYGFNVLETIFILFFLYRLYRMTVTMRVLNIEREDVHQLVRDFFAKAGLKPEWVEAHGATSRRRSTCASIISSKNSTPISPSPAAARRATRLPREPGRLHSRADRRHPRPGAHRAHRLLLSLRRVCLFPARRTCVLHPLSTGQGLLVKLRRPCCEHNHAVS